MRRVATNIERTEPSYLRKSNSVYKESSMSNSSLSNILSCPICQSMVCQARMCSLCCKMFCYSCIRNWMMAKGECPNCKGQISQSNIVNCETLARQIQSANPKPKTNLVTSRILVSSPSSVKQIGITNFTTPKVSIEASREIQNQLFCSEHSLKLQYYCENCQNSLCSDCAVLGRQHQGHRLCRISHQIKKFQQKVFSFKTRISQLKKQVLKEKQDYIYDKDRIQRELQQKLEVVQKYLNKLNTTIIGEMISQIQDLESDFSSKKEHLQKLSIRYTQFCDDIESQQKANLVRNSVLYESEIQKVMDSLGDDQQQSKKVSKKMRSIQPQFGTHTFFIQNFEKVCQRGQLYNTETFTYCGVQWRLKILGRGNNKKVNKSQINFSNSNNLNNQQNFKQKNNSALSENSQILRNSHEGFHSETFHEDNDSLKKNDSFHNHGNSENTDRFVSLYLQMFKGSSKVKSSNVYKYEILIINQVNRSKAIVCAFENEFHEGSYWGLDNFAKIDLLLADNFVHPVEKYLQIAVNVKVASYFHMVSEMECRIKNKEQQFQERKRYLENLRQRTSQLSSTQSEITKETKVQLSAKN